MTDKLMTSGAIAPFLRADKLTKRYAGVVAVDGASLDIHVGEIVGLAGKNGAGKSTLIRMLAGTVHPDDGEISVDGEVITLHSARDARRHGLAVVHQELADIPPLTVAENVALHDQFPRRARVLVDWSRLRKRASDALAELGADIDPAALVSTLSMVERRIVMIAAALYSRARLIVLDEPTATLTTPEITRLHRVMRSLQDRGTAIVYVTHRLDEIFAVCDRVVVMRDGREIADGRIADIRREDLMRWIAGEAGARVAIDAAPLRPPIGREEILRVEGLSQAGKVHDVSFSLRAGEVLGLGGLVGAGRTELVRLIAGADRATSGTIFVHDEAVKIASPNDALRHGIALLPEDRRHDGLIQQFSIRSNATIAALESFRRFRPMPVPSRAQETLATLDMMRQLDIKAPNAEKLVSLLSGGTQQKVVLAKWLIKGAEVFIFDEPTQGIDIQVKEEVFRLVRDLADDGKGVIFISADLPELVRVCSRVLVLREGRVTAEFEGPEINEHTMLAACYGAVAPMSHIE
jgi:ABC-type sugar transport system ATPase subunit